MRTCARPTCNRQAKKGNPLCWPHMQSKPRHPAEPIRRHLQHCIDHGATLNGIARECGVGVATVYELMRPECDHQGMNHDQAVRLMQATPHMNGHTPAWPYLRRVQALRAGGHPTETIAAECGMSVAFMYRLLAGDYDRLTHDTADKIRAGYDRMQHIVNPMVDSRTLANQWPPPSAWGDDIDDPDVTHTPLPRYVGRTAWIEGPVLSALLGMVNDLGRSGAADLIGVSPGTVSNLTRGDTAMCDIETARAVLRAFRKYQRQPVAA